MKYTRKFLFCVQIAQIPFVFVQNKGIFARYVPFQPRKAPLPCSVKIVTKRKQFPYKVLCGYYLALQLLRCGEVAERVPVKGGALRPRSCFCVRFRKFIVFIRYFVLFRFCILLCRFLLRAAAAFWRQSEGKRFRDPRLLFISVQQACFCERILSFSEKPHCVCALRAMLYKKEGVEMVFLPIASPFRSRYNIRKRNIFSF